MSSGAGGVGYEALRLRLELRIEPLLWRGQPITRDEAEAILAAATVEPPPRAAPLLQPAQQPAPRAPVGLREVPPELQAARLASCAICEHRRGDGAAARCGLCGCGAELLVLTARPWHKCPADRWPEFVEPRSVLERPPRDR